jgi:P2-related tail formation protein
MAIQLPEPTTETIGPVQRAARDLHEAELALHDAHQTHVDSWIKAAGDHLHRAVIRYEAAIVAPSSAAAIATPRRRP